MAKLLQYVQNQFSKGNVNQMSVYDIEQLKYSYSYILVLNMENGLNLNIRGLHLHSQM